MEYLEGDSRAWASLPHPSSLHNPHVSNFKPVRIHPATCCLCAISEGQEEVRTLDGGKEIDGVQRGDLEEGNASPPVGACSVDDYPRSVLSLSPDSDSGTSRGTGAGDSNDSHNEESDSETPLPHDEGAPGEGIVEIGVSESCKTDEGNVIGDEEEISSPLPSSPSAEERLLSGDDVDEDGKHIQGNKVVDDSATSDEKHVHHDLVSTSLSRENLVEITVEVPEEDDADDEGKKDNEVATTALLDNNSTDEGAVVEEEKEEADRGNTEESCTLVSPSAEATANEDAPQGTTEGIECLISFDVISEEGQLKEGSEDDSSHLFTRKETKEDAENPGEDSSSMSSSPVTEPKSLDIAPPVEDTLPGCNEDAKADRLAAIDRQCSSSAAVKEEQALLTDLPRHEIPEGEMRCGDNDADNDGGDDDVDHFLHHSSTKGEATNEGGVVEGQIQEANENEREFGKLLREEMVMTETWRDEVFHDGGGGEGEVGGGSSSGDATDAHSEENKLESIFDVANDESCSEVERNLLNDGERSIELQEEVKSKELDPPDGDKNDDSIPLLDPVTTPGDTHLMNDPEVNYSTTPGVESDSLQNDEESGQRTCPRSKIEAGCVYLGTVPLSASLHDISGSHSDVSGQDKIKNYSDDKIDSAAITSLTAVIADPNLGSSGDDFDLSSHEEVAVGPGNEEVIDPEGVTIIPNEPEMEEDIGSCRVSAPIPLQEAKEEVSCGAGGEMAIDGESPNAPDHSDFRCPSANDEEIPKLLLGTVMVLSNGELHSAKLCHVVYSEDEEEGTPSQGEPAPRETGTSEGLLEEIATQANPENEVPPSPESLEAPLLGDLKKSEDIREESVGGRASPANNCDRGLSTEEVVLQPTSSSPSSGKTAKSGAEMNNDLSVATNVMSTDAAIRYIDDTTDDDTALSAPEEDVNDMNTKDDSESIASLTRDEGFATLKDSNTSVALGRGEHLDRSEGEGETISRFESENIKMSESDHENISDREDVQMLENEDVRESESEDEHVKIREDAIVNILENEDENVELIESEDENVKISEGEDENFKIIDMENEVVKIPESEDENVKISEHENKEIFKSEDKNDKIVENENEIVNISETKDETVQISDSEDKHVVEISEIIKDENVTVSESEEKNTETSVNEEKNENETESENVNGSEIENERSKDFENEDKNVNNFENEDESVNEFKSDEENERKNKNFEKLENEEKVLEHETEGFESLQNESKKCENLESIEKEAELGHPLTSSFPSSPRDDRELRVNSAKGDLDLGTFAETVIEDGVSPLHQSRPDALRNDTLQEKSTNVVHRGSQALPNNSQLLSSAPSGTIPNCGTPLEEQIYGVSWDNADDTDASGERTHEETSSMNEDSPPPLPLLPPPSPCPSPPPTHSATAAESILALPDETAPECVLGRELEHCSNRSLLYPDQRESNQPTLFDLVRKSGRTCETSASVSIATTVVAQQSFNHSLNEVLAPHSVVTTEVEPRFSVLQQCFSVLCDRSADCENLTCVESGFSSMVSGAGAHSGEKNAEFASEGGEPSWDTEPLENSEFPSCDDVNLRLEDSCDRDEEIESLIVDDYDRGAAGAVGTEDDAALGVANQESITFQSETYSDVKLPTITEEREDMSLPSLARISQENEDFSVPSSVAEERNSQGLEMAAKEEEEKEGDDEEEEKEVEVLDSDGEDSTLKESPNDHGTSEDTTLLAPELEPLTPKGEEAPILPFMDSLAGETTPSPTLSDSGTIIQFGDDIIMMKGDDTSIITVVNEGRNTPTPSVPELMPQRLDSEDEDDDDAVTIDSIDDDVRYREENSMGWSMESLPSESESSSTHSRATYRQYNNALKKKFSKFERRLSNFSLNLFNNVKIPTQEKEDDSVPLPFSPSSSFKGRRNLRGVKKKFATTRRKPSKLRLSKEEESTSKDEVPDLPSEVAPYLQMEGMKTFPQAERRASSLLTGKQSLPDRRRSVTGAENFFKSFGKRAQGGGRRPNECLILEPSEMMVIDYPDVQVLHPAQRSVNQRTILALDPREVPARGAGGVGGCALTTSSEGAPPLHYHPHPHLQQLHHELPDLLRGGRSRGSVGSSVRDGSDTSSAYSGSDTMCQSVHSLDHEDVDLSGLMESAVDSDEEDENIVENLESLSVQDTVRECLEKDPNDRTENDIKILLEFTERLAAFANFTVGVRRAMCQAMVFAVVEEANTILMTDNEELDSWSVIINGSVEVTHPDGTVHKLHLGESFGITPTMEKMHHKGVMRSKVNDCQFVCIRQSDYYRILRQGEENTRRHEEDGVLVLVTEKSHIDTCHREANIVIKGTPERLMLHLVEVENVLDTTYVEDFLLTHRKFIENSVIVANKLLEWFEDPKYQDIVTRVFLRWVQSYFTDFEMDPDMMNCLGRFEEGLQRKEMTGQLFFLRMVCMTKARSRVVTLTRPSREKPLQFTIVGRKNFGIFISSVEKGSKAEEIGLKRADQILEANGQSFSNVSRNEALEILLSTSHLEMTVKSNLHTYNDMLQTPESSQKGKSRKTTALTGNGPCQSHLDYVSPLNIYAASPQLPHIRKEGKGTSLTLKTHKLKEILASLVFKPNIEPPVVCSDDSVSSHSSTGGHLYRSRSNPDLSSTECEESNKSEFPDHVLKVYRATDQSARFLLINKETTAREVVMLALNLFNIAEASQNYALYEVSVTEGAPNEQNVVKQKRLPDSLQNLAERIGLSSRYYLKSVTSSQNLCPDEVVTELIRESQVSILQLNSVVELAIQVTLEDFAVFRQIEPTEYIDSLFKIKSKYGTPSLSKFEEITNKELYWVCTEVCSEHNIHKRAKIIKQFIKIAKYCKDFNNFNSMFAILSGLGNASVNRLRQTWARVPNRYQKIFRDLETVMDPSQNMKNYRKLASSSFSQSPMIPFYPIVRKDLLFLNEGNDDEVDGLINFEKLRNISKSIRKLGEMCSTKYCPNKMLEKLGQPQSTAMTAMNQGITGSQQSSTVNRRKKSSAVPDKKKMFEEAQMVRRVKAYLSQLKVITDEATLLKMSYECEPPTNMSGSTHQMAAPTQSSSSSSSSSGQQSTGGSNSAPPSNPQIRRRHHSPTPSTASSNSSNSHTSEGKKPHARFGAASPTSERKMLSLAENTKKPYHGPRPPTSAAPHSQNSLSPNPSPGALRRGPAPGIPVNTPCPPTVRASHERSHSDTPVNSVDLNVESSSVTSLSSFANLRKSLTSGSMTSNDCHGSQGETDSGISTHFDCHSSSSLEGGGGPTYEGHFSPSPPSPPPLHRRFSHQPAVLGGSRLLRRGVSSGPPDYTSTMRIQQLGRAMSHDGVPYYPHSRHEDEEDEAQVSAV